MSVRSRHAVGDNEIWCDRNHRTDLSHGKGIRTSRPTQLHSRVPLAACPRVRSVNQFSKPEIKLQRPTSVWCIWAGLLLVCGIVLAGTSDCHAETSSHPTLLNWSTLPDLPNSDGVAGPFVGVHQGALLVAGGASFPAGVPWHATADGGKSLKTYFQTIHVLTNEDQGPRWQTVKTSLPRPLGYGVSIETPHGVVCIGGEWQEHRLPDGTTIDPLLTGGAGPAETNSSTHRSDAIFVLRWDAGGQEVKVSDRWHAPEENPETIRPLPKLPIATTSAVGGMIGDFLYLAAGDTGEGGSAQFLRLDLRKRFKAADTMWQWEPLPNWDGSGRSHAIGVTQAGQFLLFSGRRRDAEGQFELLTDAHRFDPAAYAREMSRARPDRDGKIVLPSYANGWTRLADIAPVHPDNPGEPPQPRCVMAGSGIAWGYDFVLLIGGSKGERLLKREQEYPAKIAEAQQNGDEAEALRLAAEANAIYDEHTGFSGDILAYHLGTDRWTWRGSMPGPAPVTTSAVRWNGTVVLPTGESTPGVRTPVVWEATATHSARVFGWANWVVLLVYLVGLVAVGIYCSRAGGEDQDFFLAGGKIPWWAAGVSIFATMLSAITYLSIPARSYGTDWSWFLVNMGIPIVCVLVIFLYLPFFRRLKVASAYHYLEQRFDLGLRLLGSASFILFQLGRMGVVVLLPALALSAVTGVDVFLCIVAMGALSTLYTVLGGMAAVIWTDVVQVVVLIGGAIFALMVMASQIDGGLMGIWTIAAAEGKTALVSDFHFHDLSWSRDGILVILMGAIFTNLLPYTSDQAVIQRYLTVADQTQARRALWGNAVIVIPASILFFSVGTAIWVFYKTHPLNLVPLDKPDQIFPWLIASEMPPGLAGLVIAGVFAAAMSSLDSSMHSIATAATTDFYGRLGSPKTAQQTLRMAKLLTLVLGVFGTGSAMVLATLDIQFLWDLFLSIVGLFLGTLAGLFTLGIFSTRATAFHAWVGAIASVLVLAWCRWGTEMHGLLYGGIALAVCCGVGILASWIIPSGATVDKTLTLHGLTAADWD